MDYLIASAADYKPSEMLAAAALPYDELTLLVCLRNAHNQAKSDHDDMILGK